MVSLNAARHKIKPSLVPNLALFSQDKDKRLTAYNDISTFRILIFVQDNVHGDLTDISDPFRRKFSCFAVFSGHLSLFLLVDLVVSSCFKRCEPEALDL
jgi:hypothetical protein